MTKNSMIEKVAMAAGCTKSEAKIVIDAYENALIDEIRHSGSYRIPRFGTFKVNTRGARKCRNPRTGEEMIAPEKKVVKFSMASDLYID